LNYSADPVQCTDTPHHPDAGSDVQVFGGVWCPDAWRLMGFSGQVIGVSLGFLWNECAGSFWMLHRML